MVSQEISWWLDASRNDWEAFEVLKKSENYSLAAFHLQQSAEKALKAVCLKQGRPGFTHSCTDLVKKLRGSGVNIPDSVIKAGYQKSILEEFKNAKNTQEDKTK